MFSKHVATCLVATALGASPALAQTSPTPGSNPPAAGTQVPTASATAQNVSAADFVSQAANSDMFEIQSSQLALNKAQDAKVHDFVQRMINDHTQASERLKAAAKGQTLPTSLDQEHAQKLQQLQQVPADGFTRSYVQMQFEGHQKAVSLFENYAQHGDNSDLKQFAQGTLPTLREHLQMVSQLQNAGARPAQAGQVMSENYITQEKPDVWRSSKLVKLNVYNENNEKVGDINDVLVSRDGRVEAVVIGVGGFLGIGEHNVAVPFGALQWSMVPVRANAATSANSAANQTATPATAVNPPAPVIPGPASTAAVPATPAAVPASAGAGENRAYPDHAVLPNASKDQLKSAPEFRYGNTR